MKKKKQRQMQRQAQVNQQRKSRTLGDQLNDSLMQQLKNKKKELQVREEEKWQLNRKESAKNKKNVKRINHLKNCYESNHLERL